MVNSKASSGAASRVQRVACDLNTGYPGASTILVISYVLKWIVGKPLVIIIISLPFCISELFHNLKKNTLNIFGVADST